MPKKKLSKGKSKSKMKNSGQLAAQTKAMERKDKFLKARKGKKRKLYGGVK